MYRKVQSNIVLKSELDGVLRSAFLQNQDLPTMGEAHAIYNRGFQDALRTIAAAYDLPVVTEFPQADKILHGERHE